MVASLLFVVPADAATTVQSTCSSFGSDLAAANDGDTIVLTGMCTGASAHFTLPAKAGLTIEGASTGTNGFDGTGLSSQPALMSPSGGTDGITIANLTFENYSSAGAVQVKSPLFPAATPLTQPFAFNDDSFINDSNTSTAVNGGGGLLLVVAPSTCPTLSTPDVTLSGNLFSGDSAVGTSGSTPIDGGGGGAALDLECPHAGAAATASITDNTFSHDQVNAPGALSREGGGLWIGLGFHQTSAQSIVTQSHNVFDSNSITGTGGSYIGGGEYTAGDNITSVDDQFIGNRLPGPAAVSASSEGAGLGTLGGGSCTSASPTTSQFTNLAATGNTVAAPTSPGTGATVEGAGIYAGCNAGGSGYHLTLTNATVSGNTVSGTGAVAGVDGETSDSLVLENSIVFGDVGGADVGGFGPTNGANVTATFSDVCAIGSTTTRFAGTGNICTAPALVDASTGDVHETAASPTIDAGSNALVPSGVSTDFYGQPRIVVGKLGDPATVDMGAAEFVPVAPVNAGLPVISGSPVKGLTLSTTNGTWNGTTSAFSYQWQDCDTAGNACAAIAGATSSTYVLGSADVGHTIRVVVTATNAAGSASSTSGQTATVTAPPPVPVPPVPSLQAPVLTRVSFSPSSFAAKQGTTLKFTLSTSATVSVVITQTVRGHKVRGRCWLNAKLGKRCTLTLTRATRTLTGKAGTNRVKLNLTQLAPGGYTATVSARNSAGASKRTTLTFTIKKPPRRRRR